MLEGGAARLHRQALLLVLGPNQASPEIEHKINDTIKFLNVTTSMLPNGIPFPVIPELAEIMNIIVPDMMQNALTEKMTVDEAADDAAKKIEELLSGM